MVSRSCSSESDSRNPPFNRDWSECALDSFKQTTCVASSNALSDTTLDDIVRLERGGSRAKPELDSWKMQLSSLASYRIRRLE